MVRAEVIKLIFRHVEEHYVSEDVYENSIQKKDLRKSAFIVEESYAQSSYERHIDVQLNYK